LRLLPEAEGLEMGKLKTPKGESRVALGTKAKEQDGFGAHKSGTHTEKDYAKLGDRPSHKKALKPEIKQ
jgi:hypothetical protein